MGHTWVSFTLSLSTSGEQFYGEEEYANQRYKTVTVTLNSPWNVQGLHKCIRGKWGLKGATPLQVTYKADKEGK